MSRRRPWSIVEAGAVFFTAIGILATLIGLYALSMAWDDDFPTGKDEAIVLGPISLGMVALAIGYGLRRMHRRTSR